MESEERQKSVSTPLATHFKLSLRHSPSNELGNMSRVPYAYVVDSLMYAIVCTIPDIAHVVGTISRFMSNPTREHWNALKWILRYLHGISDLKLCFGGDKPTLVGYSESYMICDALEAKLLELTKVHTDDNGTDMMTKAIPRGKFEACCRIAGLINFHDKNRDVSCEILLVILAS
ncbi:hypothetical protein CR513_41042, partial [Mucuna pruriens]